MLGAGEAVLGGDGGGPCQSGDAAGPVRCHPHGGCGHHRRRKCPDQELSEHGETEWGTDREPSAAVASRYALCAWVYMGVVNVTTSREMPPNT